MTIAIQVGRFSLPASPLRRLLTSGSWIPIRLLASTSICMSQQRRQLNTRPTKLRLGRHVKEALANGEPIVALESTVITHGLPEPENLRLAMSLEEEIANMSSGRNLAGNAYHKQHSGKISATTICTGGLVTPATIGIIKGQLVIGLSREEIEFLARAEESRPIKASRRDIPIAMALGLSAGTTVAATMAIACSLMWPMENNHYLGGGEPTSDGASGGDNLYTGRQRQPIKVFATGGTGGVHIGGETSMDISADLYEFSRSPLCVVSSGFKSFLDTRKSLELLETFGCTVMSLSSSWPEILATNLEQRQSSDQFEGHQHNRRPVDAKKALQFPGFFFRHNWQGARSPRTLAHIEEVAAILHHNFEGPLSGPPSGALLAVPIPSEFALDPRQDDKLAAAMESISQIDGRTDLEGKEKTPLILAELNRATGGKTMAANIELLKNNARIGARLALSYADLLAGRCNNSPSSGHRQATGKSGAGGTSSPPTTPGADAGASAGHSQGAGRLGRGPPVVVGCTMIDMHVSTKMDDRFKSNPHFSGVTFDGDPHLTLGGVGRNLATAIEYLGHKPIFITSLARDNLGSFALGELEKSGLRLRPTTAMGQRDRASGGLQVNWIDGIQDKQEVSSCFALVLLDSITGQCEYVIANMEARRAIDERAIEASADNIREAPLVIMDANLTVATMKFLIEFCYENKVPIFLEPTDVATLGRLVGCLKELDNDTKQSKCLNALMCLSPNVIELLEIARLFVDNDNASKRMEIDSMIAKYHSLPLEQIEAIASELMRIHLPQLTCLMVTLDKRGVIMILRSEDNADSLESVKLLAFKNDQLQSGQFVNGDNLLVQNFAPKLISKPISASGAGDSFAAGFISGLLRDLPIRGCLDLAFEASQTALLDRNTISDRLRDLSFGVSS